MAAYGLWMIGLAVAASFAPPTWYLYVWALIGLSGAAALAYGARLHRARRPGPWLFMALSLALFVTGDTTYSILKDWFGEPNPFPSLADAFYVGAFIAVSIGLTLLARSGAAGTDRGAMLDALALTIALGMLLWIY